MTCNSKTLNEISREKLSLAIKSLEYTLTDGIELAKVIYTTAFSRTFGLSGTTAQILDTIYSGNDSSKDVAAHSAEAAAEEAISAIEIVISKDEELVTGDLVLTMEGGDSEGKMYIYDGKSLCELTKPYIKKATAEKITQKRDSYEKYAVLRPSLALTLEESDLPLTDAQNEAQRAVIETAKSYLLRGYRTQYDDTNVTSNVFRWQIARKAPEDYTSEDWGYSNCAAFAIDSHRYSWGYETDNYCTRQLRFENPNKVYSYLPTGNETEKEKEKVEKEFFASLAPADIINIRYSSKSSGHAMLYVGNGNIIHSAGKNYNYSETYPAETYEPTVRIMRARELFHENDRRYVFSKLSSLEIVRPLNEFKGEIPENTKNRLANLRGVVAEKRSSKKRFNTVDRGEEITYTVSIFNSNPHSVTLDVEDIAPKHTSFVSDNQNGKVKFTVTIASEETKSVSYTVRVDENAPYGEVIHGADTKVGGVVHCCAPVYIAKTLNSSECKRIISATESAMTSGKTEIECVNDIYGAIGYEKPLPFASIDEITSDLFDIVGEKSLYMLKNNTYCAKMLVPSKCYAGQRVTCESRFDPDLARMVRPEYLMTGDVIVSVKTVGSNIYVCAGEKIANLTKKEYVEDVVKFTETILATKEYFAVLRPSIVM